MQITNGPFVGIATLVLGTSTCQPSRRVQLVERLFATPAMTNSIGNMIPRNTLRAHSALFVQKGKGLAGEGLLPQTLGEAVISKAVGTAALNLGAGMKNGPEPRIGNTTTRSPKQQARCTPEQLRLGYRLATRPLVRLTLPPIGGLGRRA